MTAPSRTPEAKRKYRLNNIEKFKKRARLYYLKNRKKIIKANSAYQKEHRAKVSKWSLQYIRDRRTALIFFLGGECKRCGFDDHRALQIDHVNGGGKKELRKGAGYTYYKKVEADKTGAYQLLCANCNWIKKHENGEHG